MLNIENISTGYGKTQVIHDFSMIARPGEIVVVAGANGSGKSTLLKCLAGQLPVWNTGDISWNGESTAGLAAYRRLGERMTYVPQYHNLFEDLTVAENLELAGNALKDHNLFKAALAQSLKAIPQLEALMGTLALRLSGGERQLLALGMVMLYQPKLLLLDEPLAGLSGHSINQVFEIIINLQKLFETCVLIVEHRLNECLPFADRLIGLKLGRKYCEFSVATDFDITQLNSLFI